MSFYGNSDRWWKELLTGENPLLPFRGLRHLLGLLPADHRCKFCHAPFEGTAGSVMKVIGKHRSRISPDLCRQCEAFARNIPGGAEIELTLMFADVRGSTALAERMSAAEYGKLVNHFYVTASDILVKTHGWVDRLVGDQVIGLYIPGFAGEDHARLALRAALDLLREMGHDDEQEPILPLGAGVHTDVAYVGAVGQAEGATDVTVLGDAANIAARLSGEAKAGEVLVSQASANAAGLSLEGLPQRQLTLKGKSEPVLVYSLGLAHESVLAAEDTS